MPAASELEQRHVAFARTRDHERSGRSLGPGQLHGPRLLLLHTFGRKQDHLVHVDVSPALHAIELDGGKMPIFARSVIRLFAVRAEELDAVADELKLTGFESGAALGTFASRQVPESILAGLTLHEY